MPIRTKFYHNHTSLMTMRVSCHRVENTVQLLVAGSFMTEEGSIYSLERESPMLSQTVQYQDVYKLLQTDVSHLTQHYDYKIPPLRPFEDVDINNSDDILRQRRQADDIYVDVLVLIEHYLYSRWYNRSTQSSETLRQEETLQEIRQYYGYVVNGIDVLYKRFSPRMNIRLIGYMIEMSEEGEWLRRVRLNESQEYQDLYRVNGDKLQDGALQLKQNASYLPAHDHLMIFTAYDLYFQIGDERGDLLGIAFYATVCNLPPFSISVIEDKEALMSVIITATHELAHGLGVDHDGDNNNCSSADRYIMSDGVGYQRTENNTYNPYDFSPCSTLKLTQYISILLDKGGESRGCLTQWIQARNVSDVTRTLPGQVYSAQEQCQIAHGAQSQLCVGAYNGDLSRLCSMMLCQDREDRCIDTFAADGTSCGDNMWCLSGHCVNATMDCETCVTDSSSLPPDETSSSSSRSSSTTNSPTSMSFAPTSTAMTTPTSTLVTTPTSTLLTTPTPTRTSMSVSPSASTPKHTSTSLNQLSSSSTSSRSSTFPSASSTSPDVSVWFSSTNPTGTSDMTRKTTDVKIYEGDVSPVVLGSAIGGVGAAVILTTIVVVVICKRTRYSDTTDKTCNAIKTDGGVSQSKGISYLVNVELQVNHNVLYKHTEYQAPS
ncbi:uncharacterized protein [Haliotis asinina]|uniref:uncharacterized protein n=1 Tax=Haliotis asinina TaxID=109174 RepID=UPI003531DEDC